MKKQEEKEKKKNVGERDRVPPTSEREGVSFEEEGKETTDSEKRYTRAAGRAHTSRSHENASKMKLTPASRISNTMQAEGGLTRRKKEGPGDAQQNM